MCFPLAVSYGSGHVSDFEIVFLIVAVFGFAFSIFNLVGVIGDYRYVKRKGIRNGRWYLAKTAIVTESGRTYLQLVFIYLAILSMTRLDPPHETHLRDYILSAIARWAFLFGATWTATKTIYTWHTRRQILEGSDNLKTQIDQGTGNDEAR